MKQREDAVQKGKNHSFMGPLKSLGASGEVSPVPPPPPPPLLLGGPAATHSPTTAAMPCHPEGDSHPPPPIPPFQLEPIF